MVALLFASMATGCESKNERGEAPTREADISSIPVAPVTSFSLEAQAGAEAAVWLATRRAYSEVARRDLAAFSSPTRRPTLTRRPSGDDADHFTVVFSANNHGEREDCGCKRSPLGGLDRRATMAAWARGGAHSHATTFWGETIPSRRVRWIRPRRCGRHALCPDLS